MVEEDHYRIFLVITAQQRKWFHHSQQKFPSSKLCTWATGFQKLYQSEMNWIKGNLQCEILLEKPMGLHCFQSWNSPGLRKGSWCLFWQLCRVRGVCVHAGEQHIWWPCDTTHNQMKENCLISPAAWFKFHFNQIGGRDKCQLVPLPYADLGGKVLHLITCMLWFSSTPKILRHQIAKRCWLLNHLAASAVHVCYSSTSFFKNGKWWGLFSLTFEANTAVAALGIEAASRREEKCSIRKFTIKGQKPCLEQEGSDLNTRQVQEATG